MSIFDETTEAVQNGQIDVADPPDPAADYEDRLAAIEKKLDFLCEAVRQMANGIENAKQNPMLKAFMRNMGVDVD